MSVQDTYNADLSSTDMDRYKESKSKSSSEPKDVSHVPCKFFRVGSCTAGSSCPFSHQIQQPSQQDVCAWFVKGNCKFGHACALAHILPGRSPAMDRRTEKAAQIAAAGNANSTSSGPGGGGAPKDKDRDRDCEHERGGDSDSRNRKSTGSSSGRSSGRGAPASRSNTPLSGSTAPALRDADFISRDTLPKDDDQGQPHNGVQQPQQRYDGDASGENADPNDNIVANAANGAGIAIDLTTPAVSSPFPVSPPRASPSVHHHHHHHSNSSDPIQINGISPGTSPRDPVQDIQPPAAPTADTSFNAPPSTILFPNPSSPRGTTAVFNGIELINPQTGQSRYSGPKPVPNAVPCGQCVRRAVECVGRPGKSCFMCTVKWHVRCELATGRRTQAPAEGPAASPPRNVPDTKRKHPTFHIEVPVLSKRFRPAPSPSQSQQQQQQQQQQSQPQQPQPTPPQQPQPQPQRREAGPSQFPGSFDDYQESLLNHSSEDEEDQETTLLLRNMEHCAARLASLARDLQANVQRIERRKEEKKGE